MFVVDSLLIVASVMLGSAVRLGGDWKQWRELVTDGDFPLKIGLVVLVYQVWLGFNELYDLSTTRHRIRELAFIGQSCGVAALLLTLLYVVLGFPGGG